MSQTNIYFLIFILLALASLLILWLIMRSKMQSAIAKIENQLTERTQQYQYATQEQQQAESALAELQHSHQHTQHILIEAQTQAQQLPRLQSELEHSQSRLETVQNQLHQISQQQAVAKQQIQSLQEREIELGHLKTDYQQLQQSFNDLQVQNERLQTTLQQAHLANSSLTEEHSRLKTAHSDLQQQYNHLQVQHERLHTQAQQAQQAHAEKISLLTEARQSLSDQFQNLANDILIQNSERFSQHNTESINRLLTPLNERMGQFSQLVQTTYEKEAKERLTIENELKRLQNLNNQLHSEAKALTEALTGTQNKTQGNWGEMILETVLENSGLTKGREYIVQASSQRTEEDGSTRRLQPDVLVNLPDNKQIIIDSKVSLTAYVRHTSANSPAEAEQALAAHVASIRTHIKSLAQKDYTQLDGVNTLDFVFMFIPVEPAYLLALQHDNTLFQECFDKRIMLVGPSTLLATLRTIANIWRNDQQNQNALAIAEEGGKLYDKFVGFVATLESVGKNIDQAQSQYQAAYKQLSEGRGNLVTRANKLHQLGVKASKQLEKSLSDKAQENHALSLDRPSEKPDNESFFI